MAVSGRKISDFHGSVSCGSAEDFEHSCDPCLAEGQHVEAHGFCVNCREYLCKNCLRCHKNMKASKHHKLLGKDEMDKHAASIKPTEVCTEKCSIHTDEILKFFCPRHDEIGCNDCMIMNHRTCDLDYIPEICVGIGDSEEYSQIMRNIGETMKEANTVMKTATIKDKEIDRSQDKVDEEFIKFRKEIIDHLNNLQKRIANDANTRKSTNKQKVQTVFTSCTNITCDMAKLQTTLQHDKASGQNSQLFIDMKRAKSRILAEDMEQAQLALDKISTQLTFGRNKDLESVLSLQNFGKLTELYTTATIPPGAIVATPPRASAAHSRENAHVPPRADVAAPTLAIAAAQPTGNISTPPIGNAATTPKANTAVHPRAYVNAPSKAKTSDTETRIISSLFLKADINVKTRSNVNSCKNIGIVELSSGIVVVADCNNNALKRVDIQKKAVIEEKELDSAPAGIAALPGDQIAVTLPNQQQILILTTADKLSPLHGIEVNGQCGSISYHQDCLYVMCRRPDTVYVLDMKGNNKKLISLEDKTVFSFPEHIVVSQNHNLYIGDWNKNAIVSVTLQGGVYAVYKHKKFLTPRGMLVLDDGSLLVCGHKTIHQVSADLKQGHIVTYGLSIPKSICYSDDRHEIYVGSEDSDLKVFDILYR